jgi:hypothetical protein
MSETPEKDNFWLYIGGLVIAVLFVVFMLWNSEHGKYTKAEKLIKEDASNSAYRGAVNN